MPTRSRIVGTMSIERAVAETVVPAVTPGPRRIRGTRIVLS